MDLSQATQAHSEWKVKLRMAITKKESLDANTISADNCCNLGKWLHGEAKGKYASLRSYSECVQRHAAFHREAGAVARVINSGDFAKATQMLDGGTAYSAASSSVGAAILGLKKEAAL
ncbi:CZB domain-containing protein [Ideonella sp. A 288]|uniref:CZB domain-containing protein n=1 Tax=Ideonella sp. A 288 TaxID=1962181 RepID=UPI000B4C1508|nr:CZB domain-containing protein [Ideonella sp. A 288]